MKNLMSLCLLGLLILVGCSTSKHHSSSHHAGGYRHHTIHHDFSDAEKWAKVFEDKKRVSWQRPDFVIKESGIKENSIIADVGSATGFFATRFAKAAPRGRVWGVDIGPNLVRYLNKRARREKLDNLFSILGKEDDPLLPEPVDFVFVVNTYHHINKRVHYFNQLKDKLKNKGKVIIIDFKKEDLPFGPPKRMKLSADEVAKEFELAGFKLKKNIALTHQYMLVFERQ